jgi:signal transduction histidine kinase
VRSVLEQASARVSSQEGAPVRIVVCEESLRVVGNGEELIRLFVNLLENARRYTPADGQITMEARREGGQAVITVRDTGCGIAPEHLPHLGERFYRVDPSRARPDGGAGLGLSICRSIAEAHGGELAFESEVGAGTAVTVTLPSAPPTG